MDIDDPMYEEKQPGMLIARHTTDPGKYLERVGKFLRGRPVEHSVLLSVAARRVGDPPASRPVEHSGLLTVAARRVGEPPATAGSDLWLWVEDDGEVVATAQHTPPHGAYLSTGPAEAMVALARVLWRLRPGLPGVGGLGTAPLEFAIEWTRLGGPPATPSMHMGLYAAESVAIPSGVPGRLRPATHSDAPLLRSWASQFFTESGAKSAGDEIGPRIDAGVLVVWEVDDVAVSMAAVTATEGGVSRIHFVYTPAANRNRGFASACVATLTARELSTPGRTCMLYTDLANHTSNRIYQAVGFRRVGDGVQLGFDALAQDPSPSRSD